MRNDLVRGTVTLPFTDIEGSTRLLHELGAETYGAALAEHRRVLREAFARHGGVEVDTQGDAFLVAFSDPKAAVRAADQAQQMLSAGQIRARMGVHTGTPHIIGEGYVGEDVHLGARIAAVGHGGQVLLSKQTAQLVDEPMTDLGEHRLKDFAAPVWIYQLASERFPPLKSISNTNLPRPASTFVGRDKEVAEVGALLRDGSRFVTLTGPGGTGKTRLAIESAAELVPEFRNGVFWVGLASLDDATLVPATINQTLGAKDGLAEHIGAREMLLLLDNLEQVIEAAPGLADLVEDCPNLRLLVTSRERLRVRGETEYSVPPLVEPEAIELFCARSGLEASDEIVELCRRLDHLPLAVELAAARASVLSPAQIIERLSRRLDLLKGGRDADPRQQTLRATIEWSHELLTDDEKTLFALMAVFRGGCTLDAAEDVVGADVDTLQSLVDKSLLRHSDERFWMLETIREFATERLEASGAAERLRARHAEYFLALAEEVEMKLVGHGAERWQALLERDHENLRSALDAFEATGRFELALRLAGAIAEYWDQRTHHTEAFRRYSNLLQADTQPSLARAKALDGASMMATKSGHQQLAVQWSEESLALHRQFGDKRGTAMALWGLGYLRVEDGDYVAAREMLRESIDLLQEVGDHNSAAWATRTLAFSYYKPGENDEARPLYEEALRRARQIGDSDLEAHALGALAEYAIDDGRALDAAILAHQSVGNLAASHDQLLVTARLSGVARVLTSLGRPDVGARLLAHAEARHDEIGAREIWVGVEAQQTLSMIHEAIDDATFAKEWEAGRKLSPDAAVALALAELEDAIERNRAS
jgi:predicted ATPase